MIMKKVSLMTMATFATLSIGSCCNDNKDDYKEAEEIHEGRVSTHTPKFHSVHQDITPEEKELAKEHITIETAPGVSITTIDGEGAKILNEHRASK